MTTTTPSPAPVAVNDIGSTKKTHLPLAAVKISFALTGAMGRTAGQPRVMMTKPSA